MTERILHYSIPMQKGADVLALQQGLLTLGYDPGVADGVFGPKTDAALRRFQLENWLLPDGQAGEAAQAALAKRLAALQGEADAQTDADAQKEAEADAKAEKEGGEAEDAKAAEGEAAAEGTKPGSLADFLAYLKSRVGSLYVWGAQGEAVPGPSWIYSMETSARNAQRAIALYEKRRAEGCTGPLYAYDCSGLIMAYLQKHGHYGYDMSSRGLYKKCRVLAKGELRAGDLVFRHNGVRIFHVGVYMGAGRVIEAKGRDEGVVERYIDASGASYWNRFGRLPLWEGA